MLPLKKENFLRIALTSEKTISIGDPKLNSKGNRHSYIW